MIDAAAPAVSGPRLWLYKRPFHLGLAHKCWVLVERRTGGLSSLLIVDGEDVAADFTPTAGTEAARTHRLTALLADGRRLEVEAGTINRFNVAIAVHVDGRLVHESHPGKRIAAPGRSARASSERNEADDPGYDPDKLKRNKVPILVDLACMLLFFVVAKLTDLKTAALVGAAVGLGLVVVQRFVRVDLIGGMMLFGVFMLLLSAGFAILFDDEEIIKQRSTIIGLIGAACFLFDGLVLKGRKLGAAVDRYIAYSDIDVRRLAIGMGLVGLLMAGGNWVAVKLLTTDAWLFYTTFLDLPLTFVLLLVMINWARKGSHGEASGALPGA